MASWFKSRLSAPRLARPSPEELFDLARRYLVQQTLAPLRRIAKGLAFGVAGAALVSLGAAIVLLGFLRLLEAETGRTFAGNWSFAPYLITAAAGAIFIATYAAAGLRSRHADEHTTEDH
jgi:hypothetical protein